MVKREIKDVTVLASKKLFTAKDFWGEPGFYKALEKGRTDTVAEFIKIVITSDLRDEIKKELLTAKNSGTPGLCLAMLNNHADTVAKYMEGINASSLDIDTKVEIFVAKNDKGVPGLVGALANGHTDAAANFIKCAHDAGLLPKILEAMYTTDSKQNFTDAVNDSKIDEYLKALILKYLESPSDKTVLEPVLFQYARQAHDQDLDSTLSRNSDHKLK